MEHPRSGESSEEAGEKPDFYRNVFHDAELTRADGLTTALTAKGSIKEFIERVENFGFGAEILGDRYELLGDVFVFGVDPDTELFMIKERTTKDL
jgi:hypothetical protein